jgi:hypothetical protein
LKQHFAKVPALSGRPFAYRNKRTGDRDSLHNVVSLEELVKSVHAFRFGPDDIFGGTSYLFSTEKDSGYLKLFGDGSELKTALTTEEFDDIAGVWFVCERIRTVWKERSTEQQTPAMERRWLVFWAVGESLRITYRDGAALDHDIRKLADPFWLNEQDKKGEHYRITVESHFKLAAKVMKKAYEQAEGRETFSHRNWFRDESTLTAIRRELESFSDFTSQLSDQFRFTKPH